MPSEDDKEMRSAIDRVKGFNRTLARQPGAEGMDFENMSLVLTYLNTENLVKLSEDTVKHSETLSRLTRWLIGLTVALGILAVVQIVLAIAQLFGSQAGNLWFLVAR